MNPHERSSTLDLYETCEADFTIRPPDHWELADEDPVDMEELRELPTLDVGPDGDLQPLDLLGVGGMGEVIQARQRALRRDVALKRVRKASARSIQALLTEARITGGLEHPNILPVYGLGVDSDHHPVLIMKRIEGVSWSELLADPEHPRWEHIHAEALNFHLDVLRQLANALEYAHAKGVIHRDIKPENVMIGRFGEVYLVDWGIAITAEAGAEAPEQIAGTPCYMAPEMLDFGVIDARTDVYLLGATLHEILLGEPRHPGSSLAAVAGSVMASDPIDYPDDVPDELAALANAACHREPDARPASALAFRDAIVDHLEHRASAALATRGLEKLEAARVCLHLPGRVSSGDLVALDGVDLRESDGEPSPRDGTELRARPALEGADADFRRRLTEARFALREALRIWPDNARALSGLDATLREMVCLELELENPDSALALLDEMTDAPPDLVARLDGLRERISAAHIRVAELETQAYHRDLDLFAARRGAMLLTLALTITVFGLLIIAVLGSSITRAGYWLSVPVAAGIAVLTDVFAIATRKRLQHALTRQIMGCFVLTTHFYVVFRLLCWYRGVSVQICTQLELLCGVLLFFFVGLLIDRRLITVSLWPAGALVFSDFFPEAWAEVAMICLALCLLHVAILEARRARRVSGSEPATA